jgi:hypothetical protein
MDIQGSSTAYPLGNHPILPPTAQEIPRNTAAWQREYAALVTQLAALARHESTAAPPLAWSIRNGQDPAAPPAGSRAASEPPSVPRELVVRLQRLRLSHDEFRQLALTAVAREKPADARVRDADGVVARVYQSIETTAYRATAEQALHGLQALKTQTEALQKLLSRDDPAARRDQLVALQRFFAGPARELAAAFQMDVRLVEQIQADLQLLKRSGDTVVPLRALHAVRAALAHALPQLSATMDEVKHLRGSPLAFITLPGKAQEVAARLGLRFEWTPDGPRSVPGMLPTGLEAQITGSVAGAKRDAVFRAVTIKAALITVGVLASAVNPALGVAVGLGKVAKNYRAAAVDTTREAAVAGLAGDQASVAQAAARKSEAARTAVVDTVLTVGFGAVAARAEDVLHAAHAARHGVAGSATLPFSARAAVGGGEQAAKLGSSGLVNGAILPPAAPAVPTTRSRLEQEPRR